MKLVILSMCECSRFAGCICILRMNGLSLFGDCRLHTPLGLNPTGILGKANAMCLLPSPCHLYHELGILGEHRAIFNYAN